MAPLANLTREERIGLLVAGTAHIALALALALHNKAVEPIRPAERITVSLAEDVGLVTTTRDPSPESAAALAPELAPLPEPEVLPAPPPSPVPSPVQTARPTPTPTATPTRRATPTPTPTATPTRRATPTPTPTSTPRPSPAPTQRATPAPTATPRATPAPTATATRAAGSRVSQDFLSGVSDGAGTSGQAAPFGAAEQAALNAAVTRQLRPHWSAPSGVDVELLVTIIEWELNEDGTLRGNPVLVQQSGITDSNRPQASLHAERAMRAVRLAAPFRLPADHYSRWRKLRWTFDRRL
ncbi:energy transducer TonB [Alteraurantiacibacter palmitatis]